MDFQTKRQSKKYAKLYYRTAYASLIFFVLLLTGLVVKFASSPVANQNAKGSFWIMLLIVSPLIISFVLGTFGQYFIDKRVRYKRMILKFRQRRFFQEIMVCIRINELDEAIDKYDELLRDHDLRCFVYPIIITKLIESTDETQHKNGVKLLNKVLDANSPADVNFNS